MGACSSSASTSRMSRPTIGLTGGIGAGKSVVAQMLADEGCVVSRSDEDGRAALCDPAIRDELVTWWGDEKATVGYAKKYVPEIIKAYNADPQNVFLCGFSRGAIGVNYLGLHDDEVARLWTAFITHDHFDGVKQWGRTTWGSPLDKYRQEALVRLERVKGRPYFVSQNGSGKATENYVQSVLSDASNFTFNDVNTVDALGAFPNSFAKHSHTDRWLSKPSSYRETAWKWVNAVVDANRGRD